MQCGDKFGVFQKETCHLRFPTVWQPCWKSIQSGARCKKACASFYVHTSAFLFVLFGAEPPSCQLGIAVAQWRTRDLLLLKTTHFVNKKLEKLFNIPSSLAPKVILGVHQANPEVTEAVKKYEVKPSMTPIHAIRDRLLQGLDQDYNVIFCFTSLKSCSPPLTSLPSSSPLLPGKSSKTALKTQRSL